MNMRQYPIIRSPICDEGGVMDSPYILIVFVLLLWLVCITGVSGEVNNDFMSSLVKMNSEDILKNKPIFERLYGLTKRKQVTTSRRIISLELYNMKQEAKERGLIFWDNIPRSVVTVRNGERQTRIPIRMQADMKRIEYVLPKTPEQLICIRTPSGGNGWNRNPYSIISLESGDFLRNLGQVSTVKDVDGNGIDELIRYEDIWELGLKLLDHATAPSVHIIMGIKGSELLPNIANNTEYYRNEIKRIDSEIVAYPKDKEKGGKLLSLILEKFLIYKLLGEMDEAWKGFDTDIRHYDDELFFLYSLRKADLDKVPIKEIKSRMIKSLRNAQH